MSRRVVGVAVMTLGVVLVAAAVAIAMSRVSDSEPVAASTTSSAGTGSTSGPSSTTTAPAATTSSSLPTTTTLQSETVAEFVDAFAAALVNRDADFVMSRLHPDVVEAYPEGTCQAWVADQIMALSDYRMTGGVTGPTDKTVTIAGRQVTFTDVYSAPVSFTFGGQDFQSSADFILLEGLVYWLGVCE
jgi:hypothetical protein